VGATQEARKNKMSMVYRFIRSEMIQKLSHKIKKEAYNR
jgi:hypothetical protein